MLLAISLRSSSLAQKGLGKGVKNFKDGMNGVDEDLNGKKEQEKQSKE